MGLLNLGVREIRRDQGGVFQGAGTAGAEIIVALALSVILGPFILFFLGLAAWKLWPTGDEIIGFIALFGVLVSGVVWLIFYLRGHWAASTAMVNQSKVMYASPQGVTFLHDDEPYTHTHITTQIPDNEMRMIEGPEEGEPPEIPTTFAEMVTEGWVAPGADYVIAFDPMTGEAITLEEPTSLGIGGVPGSGKTVTTLSLMLQSVTRTNGRVRFIVCDPHMNVAGGESLVSKLPGLEPFYLTLDQVRSTVPVTDTEYRSLLDGLSLKNPTTGGTELKDWMRVVQMEMERRREGKEGNLWLIVVDEFASVMKSEAAEVVAVVLETINQEARKMNMFAFLISQEWKGTRTGGTELRHAIASFVVHSMPPSVAELVVPEDVARKANKLTRGEVIFWTVGKPEERGMVPFTSNADVMGVMARYFPSRFREAAHVREAPQITVQTPPVQWVAPLTGAATNPYMPPLSEVNRLSDPGQADGQTVGFDPQKVAAVQAAFIEGLNITEIAVQVYGVRSAWAVGQVKDILKWLVQR